jgi:hypothetical protein
MNYERTPYVWTPSAQTAKAAVEDLAKGVGGVRVLLLVADYGSGKTLFLDEMEQVLQWSFPASYYVQIFQDETSGTHSNMGDSIDEVMDFFQDLGVLPEELCHDAEDYLSHLWRSGHEKYLTGADSLAFLRWILQRTKGPAPDPLRLLPLFGIRNAPKNRCPIRITGEPADKPSSIITKLLRVLNPQQAGKMRSFRAMYVQDLLKGLPSVLLVDEADVLEVSCLQEIRAICDETGTPLALAGSRDLIRRLEESPALKALATRSGAKICLAPVTVSDLRGVCPTMPNEVLLGVWRASKRNFRVAMLIVSILQRMQAAYPDRHLTKRAIMRAAEEVQAADGERVLLRDPEDNEAPAAATAEVGTEQDEVPMSRTAAARHRR